MKIYTDGSVLQSYPGGAWACIAVENNLLVAEFSGWDDQAIGNSGAEMLAAVHALEWALRKGLKEVEIITDCLKLCNALNGNIDAVAERGWQLTRNRGRRPHSDSGRGISDKPVWVLLYAKVLQCRTEGMEITATKVKAHSGDYWNEQADRLAVRTRKAHLSCFVWKEA